MKLFLSREATFTPPTFAQAKESKSIRLLLLFVAAVSAMLPITSVAMINSAYLALSGDLNTDLINLGCLVASYVMILAFVRRYIGVLFFLVGFRKTVLWSLFIMIGASIGSAFANSFPLLVFFFLIESCAASTFFCSAPGPLLTMLVPLKKLPLYVSFLRLFIGISSNISPILGGILVSFLSWHSLFLLNIVFTIPCLIICFFFLPEQKAKPDLLNTSSLLAFSSFLGSMLIYVCYGQSRGWQSVEMVCVFFVACASLVFLFVNCCFSKHPLFQFSPFAKKGALFALLAAILLTSCNVGLRVQSILFMRNVLHYHPFDIAMTFVLPFCCLIMFGLPAGILIAFRNDLAKLFILTGLFLEAISALLLSHVDAGSGWPQLALPLALRSIGFGIGTVAATPFILRCFTPQEKSGALLATSAPRIFTIGLSLVTISPISVLLNQWYFSQLASAVTDSSPYVNAMREVWTASVSGGNPLTLAVNEVRNQAQIFTYDHLFLIFALLALIGFAFACFSMPSSPYPLRRSSVTWRCFSFVRSVFARLRSLRAVIMRITSLLLLVPLLYGCSVGPKYKRPEIELPPQGAAEPGAQYATNTWWTLFQDPILNRLVDEALRYNFSLAASNARANAMLARAGVPRADLLPQLEASANEGTRMVTEGDKDTHHYPSRWQDSYRETLHFHFNLDLWGKYRHLYSSQKARAKAAQAERDDMRIATIAATATAWFRLLQLKETLAINKAMYASYDRTCHIYENRVRAGLSPELHLRRFVAERENVASQIHEVETQISSCQGNLAVLCGWSPARIAREAKHLGDEYDKLGFIRTIPAQVPSDLPANLMRRRPDIKAAEELLIAANENVGAAIADFFPDISLTVDEGFSSSHLERMTAPASSVWSFLVNPTLTLFDGGRKIAAKEEADEQYNEALADYKRTVSDAFRAVRDAIDNNRHSREAYENKKRQVQELLRSNYILEKQYHVGIISVMDLLDVRRQLQAAQQEESVARFEVYSAVIAICRELGGGWQDTEHDTAYKPHVKQNSKADTSAK